ncbi:MAG: hypothetical protein GX671_00580 [Clostridiales bacterium]|nr:hypothetical protein [Clostridiales bacterium]
MEAVKQNNKKRIRKPYSVQWKFMTAVAVVTILGTTVYEYNTDSHSFYIDNLFIWPAIAAVYSGLAYLLPELQSRLSNGLVCLGIILVMIGFVCRGVLGTYTASAPYILYMLMGGLPMFLAGIFIALLTGAWKLHC